MIRRMTPHLLAVIMLGILSQIAQVVLLREFLMVFHGNELSIGLILAAWVLWVGVGSRLSAIIVERVNRPFHLLVFSACGVLVAVPATILLIRSTRELLDILPGAYLSLVDITVSCFVLMAPACLLLGAQFVLLARLWRESDRSYDTSAARKTYIWEAAGNALGGIVFTFVMVRYLNSFHTAVLAGTLMLGAILLLTPSTIAATGRPHKTMYSIVFGLLAAAALAFIPLEYLQQWAYRIQWHHLAPQHQLIATYQSKHGAITVIRREDQYSFFQSGQLIFATAGPEATTPGLEEQEAATFAHMSMVQHPDPRRVLLIGGGLRGTLGEIIRHPVELVDYVELDEMLTKVARPYLSRATVEALSDSRVRLIHGDGRLYVKTVNEKYDLIIVDAPDPATAVLNRYYTEEFFREAQAVLDPAGVLVIGALSTPDLRGTAIANRNASLYHSMASVFSRVLPAGERFMFFFATDTPAQITLDPSFLEERYVGRHITTDAFSPYHFQTLLQESQTQRANWVVRNHGRSAKAHIQGPGMVPLSPGTVADQELTETQLPPVEQRYFINSDFKPIGYYYTLMFWDERARTGYPETFRLLLHVQPWWVLPLVGMPLLLVGVLRAASRRVAGRPDTNFAVIFAVFTTGLSAMVFQVALLFSFQSIYGFVYEMVGLIVAIFMIGLGLGAFLTHRYVTDKTSITTLAGVQIVIAVFAMVTALLLTGVASLKSPVVVFLIFSSFTFIAGLTNGIEFPLSTACCMALNRRPEESTGVVYATELFGACLGAALAGVVVAPLVGITACFILAAIANGTSCIVLLVCRRSYV